MILLDSENFQFITSERYYVDRDYKILTPYNQHPLLCSEGEYLKCVRNNFLRKYQILRHDNSILSFQGTLVHLI